MLVLFKMPLGVVAVAMGLAMVTGADAVSPLDSGGSTPPTATIASPAANVVIAPGGTVNFQGSGTDADGTISAYRWTFDGVTADSAAQNPGNVTFASAGTYHVYLLVTDNKGVMNFASRWIFVSSTGLPAQPTALAAFHRSGQTFLTWTENGAIAGESYRVYRHTSAINSGNLSNAQVVAQVAENSSLYTLESGGPIGQTRFIIQNKASRDVEGLGTELAAGTGLFVYTVHNSSSNNYYYAVTTVNSSGQENRTDFSSANSLDVTVGELEAPPQAVHVYTDLYNSYGTDYRGYAYTIFMDYDNWNPKYIGYAYNFGVGVPASYSASGTNRYPVVLHVEGWGSRYTPADAVNDSSITIRGDDANQCWYYGYGANRDASTYRSGFVGNYQEKYLLEAVLATMRDSYYRADTNRVYMYGHSMGGSGTLTMGTRYPKLFAATWSSEPMTDFRNSSMWVGDVTPKWGPTNAGGDPIINLPLTDCSLNGIARYNGTPVFDWQNTQLNFQKRVKDEMAYIQTGHNTDDTTIDWATQGALWYAILENSNTPRRAWSGYTGTGGHTWLGFQWNNRMMINNGAGQWVEWQFRNFEAMPGVARCSRDNARNLSWAASWYPQGHMVTVDTAARFEMTLISGTGTFTADVTPRRLQKFTLTPGQLCSWTNVQSGSAIASGTVTADTNGLVSVTNFTITTTGNRLIITTSVPQIPQVAVTSSTHPAAVATPSRNVSLTWSVDNGIPADGYSWVFDAVSNTVPDTSSEGIGSSLPTNNLDNGTYYLHVRGHGADGWGTADHYAVVVDEFEGHWREAPSLAAPTGRVVYVGTASALQTAVNTAVAGDTIMISNGTYTITRLYVHGTNITIRGLTDDPARVVLQSSFWNDSSTYDDLDDILRFQRCENVTVANLTLGECHAYGAKMEHENGPIRNLRFYHCRFVNNGTRGIKGTSGGAGLPKNEGGRVEYCSFQNSKVPPATWNFSGDYITSMDCMELKDWTISDSYFRNIKGRNGGARGAIFLWTGCTNIVVERNVFVGCNRSIAFGNPSGETARPHVANGIIRNNLFTIGADCGIELSSVTGIKLLHNTIWTGDPVNGVVVNCPTYGFGIAGEVRNNILRGRLAGTYGGLTQSGNVSGSSILGAWFNDSAAADLRLASNVTNVTDKVTVLDDCPADWDGHFRTTGVNAADVGADEYASSVQIPVLGIASTTHAEGVPTANRTASFSWRVLNSVSADGYSYVFDQSAGTVPDTVTEGTGTNVSYGGLADGTWYLHVRGRGPDGWGDADHYQAVVFFDSTPPVVSGVMCSGTTNAITVAWNTDEAANSIVRYSTTNNWSTAAVTQRNESVTSHGLTIGGLPSNQYFYVWIGGGDGEGNSRVLGAPDGGAATQAAGGSGGQSVTLQQGVSSYTGCVDDQIWNSNPNNNYGADTTAQVGGPDNNHPEMSEYRFLVDFDLSNQVPVGATITSAVLSVLAYGAYDNVSNHTVAVNELARSFVESQATWNSAATGQAWTTPGGDYSSSLGTANLVGNTGWLNYDVRTTVQNWVNTPYSHHGFNLVHLDDWKYLFLYTSEHGTAANRPKLTIGYSSAPPAMQITSTTHPDGTHGYVSNVATMQWAVVNGMAADGYSRVFDRQPATVPDTVSEGTGTTWSTNNLTAGAWFLHARAHGAAGWGPTVHFALHVGADPDADADGMSDAAEAFAGTNPLDANDVLLLSTAPESTNNTILVCWPAKAGRTYVLQHTANLLEAFTNVPNLQWTRPINETVTFTGQVSGAAAFFRVVLP